MIQLTNMWSDILDFYNTTDPYVFTKWSECQADFFKFTKFAKEHRVIFVTLKLKGEAREWSYRVEAYNKHERALSITIWELMKKLLQKEYSPQKFHSKVYRKYAALKQ